MNQLHILLGLYKVNIVSVVYIMYNTVFVGEEGKKAKEKKIKVKCREKKN